MMPAILTNCVRDLQEQGHDKNSAWAICVSSLKKKDMIKYDEEKGEYVLTEKGKAHEASKTRGGSA
jgi:hypothetical protein